jgi:hypothetical protein
MTSFDWNASQNVTDLDDDYRMLADKIIELFNPPDDDAAEIAVLMDHLSHVADFVKACGCFCQECPSHPGIDPNICRRCRALGREFDRLVER